MRRAGKERFAIPANREFQARVRQAAQSKIVDNQDFNVFTCSCPI